MSIVCYDSENNVLKQLYQWDMNQTVFISGIKTSPLPIFHFCNKNSDRALVVNSFLSGNKVGVAVPNVLLQEPESITAYVYETSDTDEFRTAHVIYIPVKSRLKPNDYEYQDNVEYYSSVVLNNRLSEALKNMSGSSAEALPEVRDIRVGRDGTVYTSAGDAVRRLEKLVDTGFYVGQSEPTKGERIWIDPKGVPTESMLTEEYMNKVLREMNDKTLTMPDRFADAKTVGDILEDCIRRISNLEATNQKV